MKEVWKPIKGYEDSYQVSNLGNVKSLDRKVNNTFIKGKVLSTYTSDKHPYPCLALTLGGKKSTKRVHRLVAEAFIPNPDNLPVVMHLDNNPSNNRTSNLRWGTVQDNVKQAYDDGLLTPPYKEAQKANSFLVQAYRSGGFGIVFKSYRQANKEGFDHTSVSRCCSGQYKQHKGYSWEKIDRG